MAGAVGVLAALIAAGAGLGIVLAGPIVDVLDYHWLFWLPAMVLAVATVVARLVIPASPVRAAGKLNWRAALLLSGWLIALLVPVSEAPSWGWASGRVLGLLAAAVVLAVTWVVVESRSAHPLIDMRMMAVPVVWTTNLVALLTGVGMYAAFAFLPEYLQTPRSAGYGFGLSITGSGLVLLPFSIAMFALGVASGRLTIRFGAKSVLVAGGMISVVPFVLLTVGPRRRVGDPARHGAAGRRLRAAFSAMSSLVVQGVPPEQTGAASGMNANIRTIGGSIGAAVMSSIVTSTARPGGLPPGSGYTHGFAVLTGATAAAALAAMLVPSAARLLAGEQAAEAQAAGAQAAGAQAGAGNGQPGPGRAPHWMSPSRGRLLAVAEPDFLRATRASYDAVAADYARRFGNELAAKPLDRAVITGFAELVLAAGRGTGRRYRLRDGPRDRVPGQPRVAGLRD